LTKEENEAIDALFAEDSVRRLVTSLKSRPDDAKIKVLDAAYWMKGCSSPRAITIRGARVFRLLMWGCRSRRRQR
jgi:hypothetical protein